MFKVNLDCITNMTKSVFKKKKKKTQTNIVFLSSSLCGREASQELFEEEMILELRWRS